MSVNIKPLEDRIVVKPLDAEQTTASGLVIPDTAKEKPQEGEVLAIGPGRIDDNGNRVPLDVNVGDTRHQDALLVADPHQHREPVGGAAVQLQPLLDGVDDLGQVPCGRGGRGGRGSGRRPGAGPVVARGASRQGE